MGSGNVVAVTVVGNDRAGIVAGVTKVLFESGCNLQDASSTILRGHFSMMLIVLAPPDVDAEGLERRLSPVADGLALSVTVRTVAEVGAEVTAATHMVSVYGADQPGIVFHVADRLASLDANITALSSRVIGSDENPVYALMLEVASTSDLTSELGSLSQELGLDVSAHPISSDVL